MGDWEKIMNADPHWIVVIDELISEDEAEIAPDPPAVKEAEQEEESHLRSLAEFQLAFHYIGPVLEAHPGWGWRDAVEWMKANGGTPQITAAMVAAKIEMLRGVLKQ
jgi:hypothetical protein